MARDDRSSLSKFVLLAIVAVVLAGLVWFGGGSMMSWLRSLHGH